MNRTFVLCCAVLLAVHAPARAQEVLSLQQACDLALANHPLVRAAQLDADAASQGVTIARSGYFPQVSANGARVFADPNTRIAATGALNDPTILDRGSVGIAVNQLLTDFGRTSSLVGASRSTLEAQRQQTNLTEADVILETTRAYYGVLRAEALVRVAESTHTARATLHEEISSLYDAKMRSELDLSIARQGLAEADLLTLRARTDVDDAYAALARALGLPQSEPRPVLSAPTALPPPLADRDALLSLALDRNPALRARSAEVEAARRRADAEARAQMPTISALGAAGLSPERDPAGVLRPHYATGGVVLDVPLFQGGRLRARERQAALQAEALNQRYQDQRNVVGRDVSIAFGDASAAFQNIDVTEQIQRNADTTLDLTQNLYEIGKSSIVDLNQAQLSATQAEITHTAAILDYQTQRALLDYLTGDLVPRTP